MLVVRALEAAERLLELARIAIAQDDEAAVRDLLGQHLLRSTSASGTVSSSAFSPSSTCSTLLAGIDHSARSCCSISAGSWVDQRSAARATSRHLRSFTCGTSRNIMTVVGPSPRVRARSVARRKPRSSPLLRLNEARKPSTTRSDGPLAEARTGAAKPVLQERARADPLAIGALRGRVLGRDREKAPAPAPDHRARIERPDDLRRLRVDQARGIQLLVREVLVAPAVGEPLAEPGAGHLPAELGLEALACLLGARSDRPLDAPAIRPACLPGASGQWWRQIS